MTFITPTRHLVSGPAPRRWAPDRLDPREKLRRGFRTLDSVLDQDRGVLWNSMRPGDGSACFTPERFADLCAMLDAVRDLHAAEAGIGRVPLRYMVLRSGIPGIYNLGGDLKLFADRIRQRDRAALSAYGHAAVDLIHRNATAVGLPLVTIALVQGDALGGGFECALSHDVIVAERGAKFGLPEILFNLFPGMGAYSFLSRRIGAAQAERIILGGRIHSAAELHEMGVVDILAADGEGELAAREFIERNVRRHNATAAVCAVRRRVDPVPEQELRDVVELWVEAALRLEEPDLRRMERLAAAQARRIAAGPPSPARCEAAE
ncbi:MAG: crotonase/enoyl-CoA hydratase family protein [Gluconacetobacter diazotrophicus]|nr:crotonase/enoyl-CoA hydratase family protein [Gluconacetobacter diazotrophicus]